jgi:hypothetical protein
VRDLLIITPSRGRPAEAARLAAAAADLCTTDWRLIFCLDDGDPTAGDYPPATERVSYMTGPRQSLAAWTNAAAWLHGPGYRALCSLGDDHVPRTPGWDTLLLDAADGMGGGFAYPDDLLQRDQLATACLVSAQIAAALGWMMLPALRHYYVDNAWMELGGAAGCLAYVPEAVVEHAHWVAGMAQRDATYDEAYPVMEEDRLAFEEWRARGLAADVAAVQKARAG